MFRLFDTADPIWGDSRPFDERMRDSTEHELAGKTPTFLKVWTPWQRPDQVGNPYVPFSAAKDDIARVRGVVGDQGVIHLDWTLGLSEPGNGGLTVLDVAQGRADAYIRSYARDVREYGQPILMTLFASEFNADWIWATSPRANVNLTTGDFVRAWRPGGRHLPSGGRDQRVLGVDCHRLPGGSDPASADRPQHRRLLPG